LFLLKPCLSCACPDSGFTVIGGFLGMDDNCEAANYIHGIQAFDRGASGEGTAAQIVDDIKIGLRENR
jgi:hypothetical protein